jgi:hypothetical protein
MGSLCCSHRTLFFYSFFVTGFLAFLRGMPYMYDNLHVPMPNITSSHRKLHLIDNTGRKCRRHTAQSSSPPLLNPTRGPHPRLARSSIRSSCLNALTPLLVPALAALDIPVNHDVHHPPPALALELEPLTFTSTSPSPSLLTPFLLLFPAFLLDDDPAGLELAYDSGSSAKLILFGVGVDTPDDALLPPPPPPLTSGKHNEVGDGDGCFIADDRGGEGGLVEDECVAFVNNRDILAVAVDVPEDGAGGGVRGKKAGALSVLPLPPILPAEDAGTGGWCSSRIFRSDNTVRFARHPSSDDEDEDDAEDCS